MDDLETYCRQIYSRIATAYEQSGNDKGWCFLSCPKTALKGAEVAFLGLNPGGEGFPDNIDGENFAVENGSAYVDQGWGTDPGQHPLQQQISTLFTKIGVEPKNALSGNLVPFRSPKWAALQNPNFSLQFGEELWGDVLRRVQPRLVISMGKQVFPPLCRILGAGEVKRVPLHWGNCEGEWTRFGSDGLLVGLPHLSRFKVMSREKSAPALRELFQGHWQDKNEA